MLLFGNQDHLPRFTLESVTRKLFNIDSNKAAGPLDPNIKIIKMFVQYFAVPLTDIHMQKIFPKVWKVFDVCSIFKTIPCFLGGRSKTNCPDQFSFKIKGLYAVE